MRAWRLVGVICETEFELRAALHGNKEIYNPNWATTIQAVPRANILWPNKSNIIYLSLWWDNNPLLQRNIYIYKMCTQTACTRTSVDTTKYLTLCRHAINTICHLVTMKWPLCCQLTGDGWPFTRRVSEREIYILNHLIGHIALLMYRESLPLDIK